MLPLARRAAHDIEAGAQGRKTTAEQAQADAETAYQAHRAVAGNHPDALWTTDVTALAARQPNPHLYFDPLVMMGVVGQATERLRVGVVVTDVVRRPPAPLALVCAKLRPEALQHLRCELQRTTAKKSGADPER